MYKLPPMVDMARTPAEKQEMADQMAAPPASTINDYPYGLSICLTQEELDKLQLDPGDVDVGDTVHLFCFAKVTSKSMSDNESSGPQTRLEMTITHIAAEDEDDENEEADEAEDRPALGPSKLYRR